MPSAPLRCHFANGDASFWGCLRGERAEMALAETRGAMILAGWLAGTGCLSCELMQGVGLGSPPPALATGRWHPLND